LRIFITGGCKNGKSTRAERLAIAMRQPGGPLYYIATMVPSDREDDARILRHQASRKGIGFSTIEHYRDIHLAAARLDPPGPVLLDSVTALFLNEMLTPEFEVDPASADKVCADLERFVAAVPDVVLVSDYIYSDADHFSELTEFYRRGLARVDRLLAGLADVVIEACFGSFVTHKGAERLSELEREVTTA